MSPIPALSVVMPVHNAMPFLEDAMRSILEQSFAAFEFVIVENGSTDGSRESLQRWAVADSRIRIVNEEGRLGPVTSSNEAVAHARAPLVARMDADDIAHPDRLMRQMEVFAAEADAVLVGSLWDVIDSHGKQVRPPDRFRLWRRSPFAPFCHPTIMMRKKIFDRIGGYRTAAARWEDVDLYLRLAREGRIFVVPEVLISVRVSPVSSSVRDGALEKALDIMHRTLSLSDRRLHEIVPHPASAKLRPASFVTAGSALVWQGRRPLVLRRLLAQGDLRPNGETLRVLVWAAWADLSPLTLRFCIRMMLRARNRLVDQFVSRRLWIEWKPRSA